MKKISLVLLAFIIPALAAAAPVTYSGVIPVFTINAGSMTVTMDDTAVRASTGALTVNLAAEAATRLASNLAIGVTTAALNTAKLAKAGDTMTGNLIVSNSSVSVTGTGFFQGSGAGLTAGSVPAAAIAAGSLGASVVASSIAANTVTPLKVAAGTYSNITLPAANVAAGALGANVIASSIAVGAVQNAALAGSIAPAKITGTAAILGANTFTGAQAVQAKVTVSTSATSGDSLCFVGAVTALPTTGYGRGCIAYLTSDPTKLYVSTEAVVGTYSWLGK